MLPKIITSLHNQRVKDAAKLRERRQREKQGRTLIDGAREIARAIDAAVELPEAFVCEPLCRSAECVDVVGRLNEAAGSVWHVSPEVFQRLAFGERAEGVLAVAVPPRRALADLKLPPGAIVAVLAGIEKPGNVGAILRTADAAGVSAVIVADPATDLYNPNTTRASLGTVFTMPLCQATSAETLPWLYARKFNIFAARVDARRNYSDVDYRQASAIVLGSEAAGLSAAWNDRQVTAVKLPMRGKADSLNVSAAAAVLFYEAQRQRMTNVE
jgi:RNA methyltransferase, TrmH family